MDEANYQLACRNVAPFCSRCHLVHAAIWDRDGQLEYAGGEEQGYRVCQLDADACRQNVRPVIARDLTSLLDEWNVDQVDYVKMDIEGAEGVVFRGPSAWLKRIRSLKIEVHPPVTWEECARILEREGFRCRRDGRHADSLIAVRRDWKPARKSNSRVVQSMAVGTAQSA
jgi:FkbM family methyltransferase